MPKNKSNYIFAILVFTPSFALAETSYDLSPNLKLSVENHLRLSGNLLGNNLDLNSDNSSDSLAYMGYTYDTKVNIKYKEYLTSFVKLESNGPFDFDAPIVSDKKVNTRFGAVDNYSFPEVIPRVEEYWIDTLVFNTCKHWSLLK